MKFLLEVNQGNGCDYTIGCGLALVSFSADTIGDAVAMVRERRFSAEALDAGDDIACLLTSEDIVSARVYQVSAVQDLPLEEWDRDAELDELRREEAAADEAERLEYERLKAKYGSAK